MSANLPEWGLTPRQQLGQRLRELRDAAGMMSMDVAGQVGISNDLASRIELGERWPKPEVVKAWGRVTGQGEQQVVDLLDALAELRQLEDRLRSEAQKPLLAQKLRSQLLGKASKVRTFATTEIPFYLQSAEYARQDVGDAAGAAEVVALRRADNEIVGAKGKSFEIILAESALRFFPCDARAMRKQLTDLQALVGAPGVDFGVIPFGATVATPMRSAFSVFDDITVVESFAGAIDLTPKSAGRYIGLMDRLWEDAVRDEAAREILTAARNALPAS
jgi:transcriptional regulator with XRE-family HTH domain